MDLGLLSAPLNRVCLSAFPGTLASESSTKGCFVLQRKTAWLLLFILFSFATVQISCAQTAPTDLPESIPQDIQDTASHFSIFERMSLLELDALGKSNPRGTADDRLDKLEESIFGKGYKDTSKNLNDRISNILVSLRPSDELVAHLVQEKLITPEWASRTAKPPWLNTNFQVVSTLEADILGKIHPELPLLERIQQLEKVVWPDKTPPPNALFSDHVNLLWSAITPGQASTTSAQKKLSNLGLLGSGGWANSLGSGMKKAGKKIVKYTQPARQVMKSPTFWTCLLLAGAVTGLYFATRGSQGQESVIFPEHGCAGEANCNHCTNCHACIWCNKGGSPKCNKWIFR